MLCSIAALAAAMFAPTAASAAEGWYGKIDTGYSFAGSTELSSASGLPDTLNTGPELEPNWLFGAGVGYAMTNGARFEFEYTQRFNQLDTELPIIDGKAHLYSYMLNGYWDFNKGGTYEPYIGAGLGYAQMLLKASSVTGADLNQSADGQDGTFAYQAMAGVAITMSPQLWLDLGVRFIGTDDAQILTATYLPAAAVERTKADYNQGAATIGLRYQFAAPAPPPPPPAPPPPPPPPPEAPPPPQVCPTNAFKVYFEWDSASLNQEATSTINQAVAAARSCNVSAVNVIGYTDTSGSPQYNLGLSQRRASVVVDAIVASGIPAAIVTADARGESELDKATADGVREPLNRRSAVTISFQ